uniref:C-type lectin domain-containing protein n=1 Tax=Oryzias melastigma TaxID=30732 RepID=A0A3B3B9V5_ORYME
MEYIWILILALSQPITNTLKSRRLSGCSQRTYYYVDQSLNWTEAQTYCRQKHTDLATIETSEEMDEVRNIVSSTVYSFYFSIGLYSNINWRWSDGFKGVFINYNYWSPEDSFHSRGDQICMLLYWYNWYNSYPQYYQWSDSSCSSLFPFVCYNGKNFTKIY